VEPSACGAPGVNAGASGGGKAPMATGVAGVPDDPRLTAAAVTVATVASRVSLSAVAGGRPRRGKRTHLNP
jgi:hypothetical protein